MEKNKIKDILSDPKNHSNGDIISCLNFLSEEHESLKNELIQKTHYLDEVEKSYNILLSEYKSRTKK